MQVILHFRFHKPEWQDLENKTTYYFVAILGDCLTISKEKPNSSL